MVETRQFKQFLLPVSIFLLVLILALFSSIPFLVRSQYLERMVSKIIQDQSGYVPTFEHLRVSFFPTPILHLETFELKPPKTNAALPLIRAANASFRPSILSLLLGKSELAHAGLNDADIHYSWRDGKGNLVKTISLNDVYLDLWNIRPNHPIRFKIRGKFLSDSENISLAGTFQMDFKNFRLKDLISKVQISIGSIELPKLAAWWGSPLPVHVEKGAFSFSGQLLKQGGISELELKGSSGIHNLVYQIPPKPTTSTAGDYQVHFQVKMDLFNGALVLKDGVLMTPFGGPFDLEAKFNIFKAAIEEIFVKSKGFKIDALPQYVLPIAEILPVNSGFSGESQLDFFVKGEPQLFLVNTRIDLGKTTLAYSQYFSKPSGVPLFLHGDLKLIAGRTLRGDFSLEFEQAALKGSVVNLDLVSGDSEVTVLTNKFSISGWQQYFPLLQQFELSGAVKVLSSMKGNFNHMEKARVMNNISFDGVHAKAANGAEIRNLNGSLDVSPLDSELKSVQFEIGNSQFSAEGKMLAQPDPRWLVEIHSPKLDVRNFISQLRKTSDAIPIQGMKLDWNAIEESVGKTISSGESFEQFELQFVSSVGKMIVPRLNFGAYGGTVSGQAVFDYSEKAPASVIEFELERLNLARMQAGTAKPIAEGNLFAVATLTEEGPLDHGWPDRLKGKGSLSVTNGEFHTLDILGGLGQIAELAALGNFQSGVTRFSDIRGDFQVENKKVKTENTVLISDDFQIDTAGDVAFDGNLNMRLSVYLAPAISQKISSHIGDNTRLGPIPILVVGTISQPSIRKDPMLIGTFLESLIQQQFSKITSWYTPSKRTPPFTLPTQENQKLNPNQPANLQQALLDSGFSTLENFLSKKKIPA